MSVSIMPLAGEGKSESLEIIDFKDLEGIEDDFESTPPAPALAKKIAAVVARPAGWPRTSSSRRGYKIPFHIFAVFDKASSGEWTLVHLHFSV